MTLKIKNISLMTVALISGIALLGWWIDHAALAAWLPGIANMTFNTALSFMLVALACCIPARSMAKAETIKSAIATFVGLFAMLTLVQDAFSLNLGIDNLFFDSLGSVLSSPHPGRMSPNTAVGFLLSALILVLLNLSRPAYATITHGLILLVVMLSLLGIGMNVLISDVPADFAHFSSISLFTAISFLLLSISLLSVHQQQNRDVHNILHVGIQLMYQLKYPSKFILISMVMLIPLTILMWNELSLLKEQVEQAKVKIIGIEHIQKTSQLIKAVPEHRGMLNAYLASSDVFGSTIEQKTAEVDRLFASNNVMDRNHVGHINIPNDWHLITERWVTIKANHQNPMVSWRMHTEIIALLGKHLRDIGSITLLSYDSDPKVHNLVAAELEILPQLFEQIGQLRGQGAGFIARKHIKHEQQLMLGAMVSQISLLLKESEQLIAKALPDQQHNKLQTLAHNYARLSRIFLALTGSQLLAGNAAFTVSPEDFFRQASQALEAGYAFNQASLKHVQNMLEQRIANSITAQYTIQLSAMLIILLILYLFAAFYQSIMNTIRALGQAAEQMKKGDVDALAMLPVKDEMGDVVVSFNTIAEELMRVSSHMSAVVDHAVDGIITIDRFGIIKSFNPASEYIFAYVQEDVVGQNVTMLMPEQYRQRHLSGLQRYNETGEGNAIGKAIEVQGLRENGDEFPMELSINAMCIDNQQMFIAMVRDVSEQQQLESQLRHAQKMEAVGALVGGVAHNFNNLLAGIVGKAYLAKRKLSDKPEVLAYLESIELISAQAGEMIKQLLTFAHKDFFRSQEDTPLDILIKETFKTARLSISEDIKLDLQVVDTNIMVHCDTNQVQQVLMNMMNNARDAIESSADKQINVRLEICRPALKFFQHHAELVEGDYACLTISDNGCGMTVETINKIFDPFYSTKEVGKGTGLGLSTAFGTITSHHGAIEVDSKIGSGTHFRIYLPIIEHTKSDSKDDIEQQIAHSSKHETLLLVDDEPLLLHSMKEVLEELGYHVIKATNGVQGLERFMKYQDHIDAVITDVVMPEMSGVEMFQQIRSINSRIPTIFMTGYERNKISLRNDEQVNTCILSKPLQIPILSQQIKSMLEEQHSKTG